MKNIFSKAGLHRLKTIMAAHKVISTIAALVMVFAGYQTYKHITTPPAVTKYVIGAVQKGTVVSVVSGTGQVSASSQIDLKSKASGNLTYIGLADGQEIKAGTLIAQIDARDALISLQNARLSLAKLTQPADAVSTTQTQNALADAIQTNKKANDTLASNYGTALSTISSTFIDMPSVIDGMNTIFYTSNGTLNDVDSVSLPIEAKQYKMDAGATFDRAKSKYLSNILTYRSVNSSSATSSIESLIKETLDTTRLLSEAVKNTKNTVDYVQNQGSAQLLKNVTTTQANLNSWLSKLGSDLDNLTNIYNNIQYAKVTITSSARDIVAKQESLNKLNSGADTLDIQQQQLSVTSQEYNYENYFIRAPFDGVIAKTDVNKGDAVSNGTLIGTFITKQQVAGITLNEVDVAKVKVGDKVTLTFDAVDGLTITGQVLEVDLAGSVTQGVVSYGVKIGFDTQDDRVRSGMSVSASIATAVHQDVLVVPSSAVKTRNGAQYVDVVDNNVAVSTNTTGDVLTVLPQQKNVTIGIADDLNTEIISGLSEGDKIVTKTIASSATAATQAPGLLNAVGAGGRNTGGAGAARALGR
ncbi:MAG: HlyD family efflux transporter periplasmic adaptor subunit [bacterium]